jgi:hypothetical protein
MSFALLFDLCGILQICLIDNSNFLRCSFPVESESLFVNLRWLVLKTFEGFWINLSKKKKFVLEINPKDIISDQ